jgi:prepilin-type N-terminal cleavage/methylation domain-containing protein
MGDKLLKIYFSARQKTKFLLILFVCLLYIMKLKKIFSSSKRAFSLLELIIVLIIISVLASLAVPQYRKFVYKSKTAEVKTILPSILHLEEMRETEKGKYITCGWYPGLGGKDKKIWSDENCFSQQLNFNTKGGTYCDYAIAQGDFSSSPQTASPSDGLEVEATAGVDITILARCDLDGDGKFSYYVVTDENSEVKGPFGDDF